MLKLTRSDLVVKLTEALNELQAETGINATATIVGAEIEIATDRKFGMPVRVSDNGPIWTFRREADEMQDDKQYISLIKEVVKLNSIDLPVIEFPSDEDILKARANNANANEFGVNELSDIDYIKHIRYMIVTNQICNECGVGIIHVNVSSYNELHSCMNCQWTMSVS